MNYPVLIETEDIEKLFLEEIKSNKGSTTLSTVLDTLVNKFPDVNTCHLRCKLATVLSTLKARNQIREVKKCKIEFGPCLHHWKREVLAIDLKIKHYLEDVDDLLNSLKLHCNETPCK